MRDIAPAPTTSRVLRIRVYAELAVTALMLMELTWVAAFYTAFAQGALAWELPLAVMTTVVVGSHYLARGLNYTKMPMHNLRLIFSAWVLFVLLTSLKLLVMRERSMGLVEMILHPFLAIATDEGLSLAGFWHLLVMIILIWRGVSLAREPLRVEMTLRSFQIGLLIIIVYGFAIAPFTPQVAYRVVFVFLVSGFLALAFTRLASISELRGGKTGRFSRQWLTGITISALVVTALALLAAYAIHRPVTGLIKGLTLVFLALVSFLTLLVTYPILLLFESLGPLLAGLLDNMPSLTIFKEMQSLLGEFTAGRVEFLTGLIPTINTARLLGRFAILAAILAAILLALRWRSLNLREPGEENVTDLSSSHSRVPRPFDNPPDALRRLANMRRILAAARIRRIYAEMMDLSARLGHPRKEAVTPLEFLPELTNLFTGHTAELETITQAYLQVRYGELPESALSVEPVERAWALVRGDGRKIWGQQRRDQIARSRRN